MTLLVTVLAAVICSILWYKGAPKDEMRLSTLCFMLWGASIMWLGDAIFGYAEDKAAYFTPAPMDMLNDAFLGLSVVALALIIWLVRVLVTDPKGVVRKSMVKSTLKDKSKKEAHS